jgi:hypothetical protein
LLFELQAVVAAAAYANGGGMAKGAEGLQAGAAGHARLLQISSMLLKIHQQGAFMSTMLLKSSRAC